MMWRFTKCNILIVRLSAIHVPHNLLFFHEGVSIYRRSWVKEEMKFLVSATGNNLVSVNNMHRILWSLQQHRSTLYILYCDKYFKWQNLLYPENESNGFLLKLGTYPAAQLYRPQVHVPIIHLSFRKCCFSALLSIQNYTFLQIKLLSRGIAYVGYGAVADGRIQGVAKGAENEYLNKNCVLCSEMFKILR